MRNWEEKYEKLKNGDFDDRINELKTKIDEKKATREEFKEYEKLLKSKENLGQVKNILEYKDLTNKKLQNLKKEIEYRENMKNATENTLKLEKEMDDINAKLLDIKNQLKNPNLEDDKKNELIAKQNDLFAKRDENNKRYLENQAKLAGAKGNEDLKGYSNEELKQMKLSASARISKINMIANSLINGYSWDSIDLKLDNWQDKKFNSKDGKLKDVVNTEKNEKPEYEDVISSKEELRKNEKAREEKNKTEFEKKHPMLSKIGNWFKKTFKRVERLPEPKKEEPEVETKINKEDKNFKEYIREIAEKGMDGIKAEEIAKNKERLAKLREEKGWRQGDIGAKGLTEEGRKALNDIDDMAR